MTSHTMVRYELPFPPSVNNLFVTVGSKRVRSTRYKAWAKEAGQFILLQGRKRVRGPVSLSVALVRPDRRTRDLSNTLKAIEDLLVDMSVIDDDSLIHRLSVQWVSSGAPCVVLIQEAVEEMAA
ncbi:MAG: RusA family crossover junction endodeoxyribonuclease [Bradyrhizobium sp.]|uniref:RusA family crossover junction endodeoxyribonuclease n=1 Tax=Bradyrhizobium sp. TaxID=376 RepID=UPI003D0C1151